MKSLYSLSAIVCFALVACNDDESYEPRQKSQQLQQSGFEESLVEQTGRSIEDLRERRRRNAAAERREIAANRQREAGRSTPPSEIDCSVSPQQLRMSSEALSGLRAELERKSVAPLPPGVREIGEPTTTEDLSQPPVPFEVRPPSDAVLARQQAYFDSDRSVSPDLSAYPVEERERLYRRIARVQDMLPVEMLEAVQAGDISFEVVRLIANAESANEHRREKYEHFFREK
jgi:hypothetical protein